MDTASYRQGVFDAVDALGAALDELAHVERNDPALSDQHAEAARSVRRLGRQAARLLELYPDTDLAQLPPQALVRGPRAVPA